MKMAKLLPLKVYSICLNSQPLFHHKIQSTRTLTVGLNKQSRPRSDCSVGAV